MINDGTKNAFVLPGGKVFVFRGLFQVCPDDDSLATVLGHEIAHNVAGHVGEKMSRSWILMAVGEALNLVAIISGFGDVRFLTSILGDLGFSKPNSRVQESEADYIGLSE